MFKTLVLSLLVLMLNQASYAYTLIKADEFDCVREVIPASGLPNGIVTDNLETGVFVKTCEGDYASVRVQNGKVTLVEIKDNNNVPSRQLKNKKTDLIDSEMSSSKTIRAAWLTGATKRYRHGILGDEIEASGLVVIDRTGKRYNIQLGEESVFEDRKVRIADLDKDGQEEIIVVRSYLNSGAALAVYGIRVDTTNNEKKLISIAETPSIGLSNRWLNPAIVADVDNDGELEIAYVETPHIGGILHVLALRQDKLVYKYRSTNTSNHAIGSRVQELAASIDWDADGVSDIAVPNANRTVMRVFSYAKGKPEELESIDLGNRILSAVVAADLNKDNKPELIFALFSGELVVLTP
ncbi:MAG: hypothetical protein ACI88H_003198 [Cocleimonas sp.]